MDDSSKKCPKCHEPLGETGEWDGVCIDCWPGYDLCDACGDYRCEHLIPDAADLANPSFASCHCGHAGCRTGFVEGSTQRIVTRKEFAAWLAGEAETQ